MVLEIGPKSFGSFEKRAPGAVLIGYRRQKYGVEAGQEIPALCCLCCACDNSPYIYLQISQKRRESCFFFLEKFYGAKFSVESCCDKIPNSPKFVAMIKLSEKQQESVIRTKRGKSTSITELKFRFSPASRRQKQQPVSLLPTTSTVQRCALSSARVTRAFVGRFSSAVEREVLGALLPPGSFYN